MVGGLHVIKSKKIQTINEFQAFSSQEVKKHRIYLEFQMFWLYLLPLFLVLVCVCFVFLGLFRYFDYF